MFPVAGLAAVFILSKRASALQLSGPQTSAPSRAHSSGQNPEVETFQVRGVEGIHCQPTGSLASKVVPRVPELASWNRWYSPPRYLTNGHVHTIAAFAWRTTRACKYHRQLLPTPDGGTLALDLLVEIEQQQRSSSSSSSSNNNKPPLAGGGDQVTAVSKLKKKKATTRAGESESKTIFVESPPSLDHERPFLLLISGLGGGSQDTYVRSMATSAADRGWQVGVLNMRGCGGSPITSPRFFSAFRGSTDDVRLAVRHIRTHLLGGGGSYLDGGDGGGGGKAETRQSPPSLAVLGWSNGGTIVNNLIAEQATTHATTTTTTTTTTTNNNNPLHFVDAGVCLASPLCMVSSAANLKRPFHSAAYDRSIAKSLASKFAAARHLFEEEEEEGKGEKGGAQQEGGVRAAVPVPRWEGLATTAATATATATARSTARSTARCTADAPAAERGVDKDKGADNNNNNEGGGAGTFMVDVEAAVGAKTIREIDAALTAPCFGFDSVDDYYESASSGKRLKLAKIPLLVLSAFDDPIAVGSSIPFNAAKENPEYVVLAVTERGGHLGWCDRSDPWGGPGWVERASVGFLEAALDLQATNKKRPSCRYREFSLED